MEKLETRNKFYLQMTFIGILVILVLLFSQVSQPKPFQQDEIIAPINTNHNSEDIVSSNANQSHDNIYAQNPPATIDDEQSYHEEFSDKINLNSVNTITTTQKSETLVSFQAKYGSKGIGDAWQSWVTPNRGTNLNALDYDWYYDWSFSRIPQRNNDPNYVRMVWCAGTQEQDIYGTVHTIAEVARDDYENGRSGRVWLLFNEPDAPGLQCGETFANDPVGAAKHYSIVYDMIKENDPNARVFAGGLLWLSSQETRIWWWDFIDTLALAGELDKVEGVHIHLYPTISDQPIRGEYGDSTTCDDSSCLTSLVEAANDWYQEMHVGNGLGERPIWITEAGWLFCEDTTESWIENQFMKPLTQWFANDEAWPYPDISTNPGYETIAWYVSHDDYWFPCTYLLDKLGASAKPTNLGKFWNQFLSSD